MKSWLNGLAMVLDLLRERIVLQTGEKKLSRDQFVAWQGHKPSSTFWKEIRLEGDPKKTVSGKNITLRTIGVLYVDKHGQ